jgi:small subunit ribosomal protein S20
VEVNGTGNYVICPICISAYLHIRTLFFVLQKEYTYLCPPETEKRKMANHKATKKDVRQSRKRNERNRYYGKTTRNAIRDLKALTDKAAAQKDLSEVVAMIDKLAKRNVIHKNKASNLKSKLAKKVNALA